jgi:inorganic pyrophosphatase
MNLEIDMLEPAASASFWDTLDQLVASHLLVIDRPKGSSHPRYPEILYPLDYGYLEGTTSGDGGGIDVWLGVSGTHDLSAVILTVDLLKSDVEIKMMLGCSKEELQTILVFHNQSSRMRATLVRRPAE